MKFLKKLFCTSTDQPKKNSDDKRDKFIHIKTLVAQTNLTWRGSHYTTLEHSYILKENGYGERRVVIVDGAERNDQKHYAKNSAMYVRVVVPWQHGAEFSDIPTYQQVYYNLFVKEQI